MPRPYKVEGKYYRTAGKPPYGWQLRKTKNAAGMSATSNRSGHHKRGDCNGPKKYLTKDLVLTLRVRGTLDDYARTKSLMFQTERVPCPCCGAKNGGNKVRLNKSGRERLRAMRRKRDAQQQNENG